MDKAYVIALVHAWISDHPEHVSTWVNPYWQLRWDPHLQRMLSTRVGGHWRRLALWGKVLPALSCACKFERLSVPRTIGAPPTVMRPAWTEDGTWIPRRYRVYVWA